MQDHPQPLSAQEALPAMRSIIESGGDFLLHVTGGSMSPTLCGGRDSVLISPLLRRVRRGDILLLQTESRTLLLHRVIKCEKTEISTPAAMHMNTEKDRFCPPMLSASRPSCIGKADVSGQILSRSGCTEAFGFCCFQGDITF